MSHVSAEAGAFISHLMACRNCYAPNHRYCSAGLELHVHSDAAYIAAMSDIGSRRYWRSIHLKHHPQHNTRLDELIKIKFEQLRALRVASE